MRWVASEDVCNVVCALLVRWVAQTSQQKNCEIRVHIQALSLMFEIYSRMQLLKIALGRKANTFFTLCLSTGPHIFTLQGKCVVTQKDGRTGGRRKEKTGLEHIGCWLQIESTRSSRPPPICLCECFTRARWIARGNIHLSMQKEECSALSGPPRPPPSPPLRQLKQHIVPAALDFHCFNAMSFFKRGLSEAFRL